AAVKALQSKGMNFSMGLAQVNKMHMSRFNFTAENIFEPCANVRAGAKIFNECHTSAKKRFGSTAHAIGAALSCYYSGNFTTGFKRWRNDKAPYVDSVRAQMKTYAQRPEQIGTPQLQKVAMNIKIHQAQPKLQTAVLQSDVEIAKPKAYYEKPFLMEGEQTLKRIASNQPIKQNSTLLF
ncbi:transglycosylase SLT domain-containing protein, partial [Kingella kingae]|uniref:transglycosylase SLT domain-containing protein n=1 Tax=Kingella kingae TaxID=504 RepID=UPI00254E7854